MAFMGIFISMVFVAILGLMLIIFALLMVTSAIVTLSSGICWGVMKKKGMKNRNIPLILFIGFGILLAGMICIVLACHLAFVKAGNRYDSQYINQYTELGVYAEETSDEIDETDCITLNGIKYYMPGIDSSIYHRSRGLTPEYLTPVANVSDDDLRMIYSVKNDAGADVLWYDYRQYFTEDSIAAAEKYYENLTAEQELVTSESSPYYGYTDITFETELFNRLYTEWKNVGDEIRVQGSFETFYIIAFSPDNVAIRDIHVCYINGEVYFYKYHNKYPIKNKQAHDALLQIAETYYS